MTLKNEMPSSLDHLIRHLIRHMFPARPSVSSTTFSPLTGFNIIPRYFLKSLPSFIRNTLIYTFGLSGIDLSTTELSLYRIERYVHSNIRDADEIRRLGGRKGVGIDTFVHIIWLCLALVVALVVAT